MNPIKVFAQNRINNFYYGCSKDVSKMLTHASAIGWAASSAAQIVGVALNDKISDNKKKFLIPQETLDATGNIVLFYVVTRAFDLLAKTMFDEGKIKLPQITKVFENRAKHLGCTVAELFKDKFGQKISIVDALKFDKNALDYFNNTRTGLSLVAAIAGGILSCNILTPIFRNYFGAKFQAKTIDKSSPSCK